MAAPGSGLHAPRGCARHVGVGPAVTCLTGRRSEVALRAMNQGGDEPSLACLIERSAELKRALVDFALSPRMERHLERFMVEGAGPQEVLIEDEAIDAIDRFALLYHLPNGKTVLDQFLASWPDLSAAHREIRAELQQRVGDAAGPVRRPG